MEQFGAAASGAGGGGEEPGVGRSNKRSAGNRAANEEETKNKPKLVSAPATPTGLGDPRAPNRPAVEHAGDPGPPPSCNRGLAAQLGEQRRLGGGRALFLLLTRPSLVSVCEGERPHPDLGTPLVVS